MATSGSGHKRHPTDTQSPHHMGEFLTHLDTLLGQLEYDMMDFSEEQEIASRIVDNSEKIVRELKALDDLNREETAKLRKKEQQVLETQGIQRDNQKRLNKHLTTLIAESRGLKQSMQGLQAEQDNFIKALENQIKKPDSGANSWEVEEDQLREELELHKNTLRLYINVFGLRFNKNGVVYIGKNGRLLGASYEQPQECMKLCDAVWAGNIDTN